MQYFKIILIILLSFPLMAQHGQYIKGFDCPTCTKADEDETIMGSWDFTNSMALKEIRMGNSDLFKFYCYNRDEYSIFDITTNNCSNAQVKFYIPIDFQYYNLNDVSNIINNDKTKEFKIKKRDSQYNIFYDNYLNFTMSNQMIKFSVDNVPQGNYDLFTIYYNNENIFNNYVDISGLNIILNSSFIKLPYLLCQSGQYLTTNESTGEVYCSNETDPVWTSDKSSYYTKTETNNLLSEKVPYTGATSNVDLGNYEITSAKVNTFKIDIADAGTRPECNSDNRGLIWNDEGSTGYSDMLSICIKGSDDTYQWQELYSEQYDPDGWDGKNEMNCFSTGICHEYYQNSFPYNWQGTAPNTIEWKRGYYSFGHSGALTAFAYYNVGNISGNFELRGKVKGKGKNAKVMIFVATSSGSGYAIGRGDSYKGVQRATLSSWTPTYSDENTYYSIFYFKIIRTGSDIYHYYSENGIEWTKWGYASDTATFNYIGWLIYISDANTAVSIDWLRFKQ